MNLANTLTFPSTNRCQKKNVITSTYLNVTKCLNNIAPNTLFPIAKKFPRNNVKKCPKNLATTFITTHLVKQSTGNAKKRLNRTSTNTKQNMKRSANKLKYPNVLPSTLKSVNTRRSNIVKPLTKKNVNMNKSKNVKLSTKQPMKRNKNVTQLT